MLQLWFTICFIVLSLHVCPGEIFILDGRLAKFGERNRPFGFLLVILIVVPLL